jgi:hypothetical protein
MVAEFYGSRQDPQGALHGAYDAIGRTNLIIPCQHDNILHCVP